MQYLLRKTITITSDYLQTLKNVQLDWESRQLQESIEWKLNPRISREISRRLSQASVDLFDSLLTKQMEQCISWKDNPCFKGAEIVPQVFLSFLPLFSNRERCKEDGIRQNKNNINSSHVTIAVFVSSSSQNEYNEVQKLLLSSKNLLQKPRGNITYLQWYESYHYLLGWFPATVGSKGNINKDYPTC